MNRQSIFQSIILLALVSIPLSACTGMHLPFALTQTSTPTLFVQTIIPTETLIATITSTPTVGPDGFPKKFHVEGNAFVDQFGQKKIFRGLVAIDPLWQNMDTNLGVWGFDYYYHMAQWGANITRLVVTSSGWKQYIDDHGKAAAFQVLDQSIEWAGKNHMYVIIDFHALGFPPTGWSQCLLPPPNYDPNCATEDEVKNFWKDMSQHYANNDVVAFYELFNEPEIDWAHSYNGTIADWNKWKAFMEEVIRDIRRYDQTKIVLVAGLDNASNLEYVPSAPISDPSNNLAYVVHPYSTKLIDVNWDYAFGKVSDHYAVIATEFNYSDPDINITGVPYHKAILDYLEAHHISWTVWCFNSQWSPNLITDNETYTPTAQGTYFRSELLKLNQQP